MFDAAARNLNFRLAAEELNLSQGAVAQQVRQLESSLGIRLFYRKARGLELTEAGRSYHLPIRRALAIIDDATSCLQPEKTEITLSVTPSFAAKFLVPRLAAFSQRHPEIKVHTVADMSLANFQSDGIDIAIRLGHPPFDRNLHCEQLAPLDLRAVCSPEFAEDISPILTIEDFPPLKLIQDNHNLWDELFEEAKLSPPEQITRFTYTTLAIDAAANGQGIALAPRILVNQDLEQGKLVELWKHTRPDQGGFYIVFPRDRISNLARDVFIEWILLESRDIGRYDQ